MNKKSIFAATLILLAGNAMAQRVMDKLDRGVVAVNTGGGNFVSWRVLGEDADNVRFNLYRDGSLVNAAPLNVSNFTDASGSASSSYVVKTVVDGVEKEESKSAKVWAQNYLEIKVAPVPSNKDGKDISSVYEPNDATVADLDGDGVMEILIKLRNTEFHGNGYPDSSTDYDIIQAYRLDGTLLWWIDCGRNMVDFQSNEINIAAYDWDLDGKAEIVLRLADGSVLHMADGTTQVIGDPTVDTLADARNNGMSEKFTHSGGEYLVYAEGLTAKPYQVMEYPLKRLEEGEKDLAAAWGDGYGHRSSKHFFGAPYLDGRKPSIFLARGIYTRHKMVAYDVDPATHQLVRRWYWFNNTPGSPWYGQGYHNYNVADVDWDGRDEIIFGSMVIDDNGKGLSTTGLGHGDSMHTSDFNPYIHGQEVVACNEDSPNNNFRDATTSKIYYRTTGTNDDGRCIAGNFSNEYPGAQFTSARDFSNLISTVVNKRLEGSGSNGVAQNFRVYWDGDLLDETFNGTGSHDTPGAIYKYGKGNIHTFAGTSTNNYTKATPCFQGDILGDWREEIILRAADNHSFRIYTTTIPTDYRIYTLLHDPQYRNAMVWQMNGYNQTPHPSFFLGELEGITQAPPSPTMNGREELMAGGTLSGAGKSYVFAETGDATASIADGASPDLFVDAAPSWVQGNNDNENITYKYYTHTLTGGGFAGNTRIVKLGDGTLVMPKAVNKHTGNTEVWFGELRFDGEMQGSPVWLNRHTTLTSDGGKFGKGIVMNYGSTLSVGAPDKAGEITAESLELGFGAAVVIGLGDNGTSDKINVKTLKIEKKVWENGPELNVPVIRFEHIGAASTYAEGDYDLGVVENVEGNLADLKLEGLNGQKVTLAVKEGHLMLSVAGTRAATEVVWTGSESNVWDIANSANFVVKETGEPTSFVSGDRVVFDDTSKASEIVISEAVYPSEVIFSNNEKTLTVSGAAFSGNMEIRKSGAGRVILKNTSDFTGAVSISGGALEAASLGANEGTAIGSLGVYGNTVTLDSEGMLAIEGTTKLSHPIVAVNGGIEVMDGTATLTGAAITGDGTFIKSGKGVLEVAQAMKASVTRIDGGVLYDLADAHQTGSKVVFNGKNTELRHKNSDGSYSSDRTVFEVAENATGTLTLDGRCSYSGKLTGKGELTVVSPWIRADLGGDWSEYEGTVIASQSGSKSSFNFTNKKGLPKAILSISSSCVFSNRASQSGAVGASDFRLAGLAGTGKLGGNATYTVNNTETCSFQGTVESADVKLVKEGPGKLVISKPQTQLKSFVFNEGEVELRASDNEAGPMLGTGDLVVKGTLSGRGHLGNSSVNVAEGGVLAPTNNGKSRKYRTLTFDNGVTMADGSKLICRAIAADKYGNIVSDGATRLSQVELVLEGYQPAEGTEFTLWTAPDADAVPALTLPSEYEWDRSKVTAQSGVIVTGKESGVDEIGADEFVNCEVISLDGIVVSRFAGRMADVSDLTGELPAGIYNIVAVSEGGKRSVKKVVVK